MSKIISISGPEPFLEGEYPEWCTVGEKGELTADWVVGEIKRIVHENPLEGIWYTVYDERGNNRVEMNERYVAVVRWDP